MKTLEKFDFGRQVNRKSSYDWAGMLDGQIHVLEAGKDFSCKAITLKSRARAVAKKMGLSVRTGTTEAGDVVIQSYEPKPSDGDEFKKIANAAKAKGKPAADEVDEDEADGDEGDEGGVEDEEEGEEEVKKPARRRR